MSRNHLKPGEIPKHLWANHEIHRTEWISDRADARVAIGGAFGEEVAANGILLEDKSWGKVACIRLGALAWAELEAAGTPKRVTRAVVVRGSLERTELDLPIQELLSAASTTIELTPQAVCAAFEKFGTGGRIVRKGKVQGFGRTTEIRPPTLEGDELKFSGTRGHRVLSCVCHIPSRRAWMNVLANIDINDVGW